MDNLIYVRKKLGCDFQEKEPKVEAKMYLSFIDNYVLYNKVSFKIFFVLAKFLPQFNLKT